MKKAAVILLACALLLGCACASAEDADVHAAPASERDVYIARVLNDCLEMNQVERAGVAVTQGYAVFGGGEHISTDADLLERAVFTDVDFSIARSGR